MTFEAAIPSSANNPFVSVSSLPEGTLFICVGAILLGLILLVAVWRQYAIFAARRAARLNESRFTALEPSYGGPFKDPVGHRLSYVSDDGFEKDDEPEVQPLRTSPTKTRLLPKHVRARSHTKSQAERMRDAQKTGKFFSPTADVLQHGAPLPANLFSGSNSSASSSSVYQQPQAANSARLSVLHSGRNSIVHQASMSSSDLLSTAPGTPMGPPTGTRRASVVESQPKKKLRPPSVYLDSLG